MFRRLLSLFRATPMVPKTDPVAREIEAIRRMAGRSQVPAASQTAGRYRSSTPSDNPDYHSSAMDGEWGRILRRGTDGRPLSFDYGDRWGRGSARELSDWVEYPRYIQGLCSEAGVLLCFRKDRVTAWHNFCDAMLRAPKGRSRQ